MNNLNEMLDRHACGMPMVEVNEYPYDTEWQDISIVSAHSAGRIGEEDMSILAEAGANGLTKAWLNQKLEFVRKLNTKQANSWELYETLSQMDSLNDLNAIAKDLKRDFEKGRLTQSAWGKVNSALHYTALRLRYKMR